MTAKRKLTPSQAREYERRIDNLEAKLDDEIKAVDNERKAYLECLPDDEKDLAWDGDDTDDDNTADRLRLELENAEGLRADLEDGDCADSGEGVARLEEMLKNIEADLRDWPERRAKRPY